MVSPKEESPIYNIKLSSVGPGRVTGQDVIHEPSSMDLAMKLHYLRGVYYFRSRAFQGLTTLNIKEPMFTWLNQFYIACGRFRRFESGRPYIKCNDCGARFIEAQCDSTIDEVLEKKDNISLQKLLVSNQVIGPELGFSPLVLIQLTRFKCGGMSVGLSWAHVLGDALFASEFMNAWGKVMAGHQPGQPLNLAQSYAETENSISPPSLAEDPLSLKRVGPVGDHWIFANNCKMESSSFHVSAKQLSHLQSKICRPNDTERIPQFESLCAIIWQCVAKVKDGPEPKVVTICKNDSHNWKKGISNNTQAIGIVKADFSIIEADPRQLGSLITNQVLDERRKIEEAVERDNGLSDFIVYGANLTFVDLEDATFYGLEMNGQKPVYVSCTIDGIGDEGVVLVLPGPKDGGEDGSGGRIVTITLPENQLLELKSELKREWSIV